MLVTFNSSQLISVSYLWGSLVPDPTRLTQGEGLRMSQVQIPLGYLQKRANKTPEQQFVEIMRKWEQVHVPLKGSKRVMRFIIQHW